MLDDLISTKPWSYQTPGLINSITMDYPFMQRSG